MHNTVQKPTIPPLLFREISPKRILYTCDLGYKLCTKNSKPINMAKRIIEKRNGTVTLNLHSIISTAAMSV